MHAILKDSLKKLLEPHFHSALNQETYQIETKDPMALLTANRFDLAFKLFYLDMREKHAPLAQEVYLEHIRAFSLGKFTEPGNETKRGKEKFVESFEATFEDIRRNGFEDSRSLIPLSYGGTIANGAHRVASAIKLARQVACVQLDIEDPVYDYRFFYSRGVPPTILDIAATTFAQHADNLYIAFIWPIGTQKESEVERMIPNVVYKKTIRLNANGAHNLLSQIYAGEAWLGSREDNFGGVNAKLAACFKSFEPFNIYAFQANSLDEVLRIKEDIRRLFGVGKHSVHITDTKEEAQRMAKLLFNENGLHFLNHAKPNRFASTYQQLEHFQAFMQANTINHEDIVIDSSVVLSCYGIREAKDIDYLLVSPSQVTVPYSLIHSHDEALAYYRKSKEDIVYDPRYHFWYEDLKFVSFGLLYEMKRNRDEPKDRNDCKMMEALLNENGLQAVRYRLQQRWLYMQIRIRQSIITLLQRIGLFDYVYKFYKKMRS